MIHFLNESERKRIVFLMIVHYKELLLIKARRPVYLLFILSLKCEYLLESVWILTALRNILCLPCQVSFFNVSYLAIKHAAIIKCQKQIESVCAYMCV